MKVISLGRQTDFIFARFAGSVADKGSYTLIQMPDNPGYHWGNYLVFDHAPRKGSLDQWKKIFDQEFSYYLEPHHYTFAWDTGATDPGKHEEFLANGFEFDSTTVLQTAKLNPPKHLNTGVQIRKISSDQEWAAVIELQVLCSDPKYMNDYYMQFKMRQMDMYRLMVAAGRGNWFGAYLGEKLVADLGIFFEGKLARYQSVGTHPEFRNQGICGTLVYKTGLIAFAEYGVTQLVMEADVNYHAARIYESVGFQSCELNHSLSWWRGKA